MLGRRTAALAALTITATAVAATGARAADTHVDSCGEALQQALDAGGVVVLDARDCTGAYQIASDVELRAGVAGAGFAADGNYRSLTISNAADVTLSGLSFTRGADAAQGLAARAAQPQGGGVRYGPLFRPFRAAAAGDDDAGDLVVEDSTFTGLHDGGSGGGLFAQTQADAGTVTLTRDAFTGGQAGQDGGGAAIVLPTTPGGESAPKQVVVTGTTFDGNEAGLGDAESAGGGLSVAVWPNVFFLRRAAAAALAHGVRAGDVTASPGVELSGNTYVRNQAVPGLGEARSGGGAALVGVDVTSSGERYLDNGAATQRLGGEGGGLSVRTAIESIGEGFTVVSPASLDATNLVAAGNTVGPFGEGAGVYGGTDGDETCGPDEPAPLLRAAAEGDVDEACTTPMAFRHATIVRNAGAEGAEGGGIAAGDHDPVDVDASIVWGNTTEPAATRQRVSATAQADEIDAPLLTVKRSDYCEIQGQADLICADPKLVDPDGAKGDPDVHQTSVSPTLDQVTGPDDVPVDYERPTPDPRPLGAKPDMGADEYPPVVATETPTPTPTPTTTAAPTPTPTPSTSTQTTPTTQPPAASGVLGQTQTAPKCASKRFFRVVLRKNRGPYRSAKLWVNGEKVKVGTYDKRPSTVIDLRRFGYQTIHIRIVAKLANGKTIKGKRTYHPCRPSLDDGVPPRL